MQKTSRQIDDTSLRLASGLDVNSALDNPNNYFMARSLRDKAADLTRLMDGIGQSIRVIQQADHGVEAELEVLDLAENYLLDLEKRFLDGYSVDEVENPTNETYVTFSSNADLVVYNAPQDVGSSGTITVPSSNEVDFEGNYWRRKAFNYNVTADSVMVLEFRSTVVPENVAIGFDNDTNFGNDDDRFYLYGSQPFGITYSAPTGDFDYTGAGDWQEIEIPIGQFFTGNYSHITFISDDDVTPYGNSMFRNITLREGPKQLTGNSASIEEGYLKIVNQLDGIVKDANYRGINLLGDDNMTTKFNPDGSSRLVTEGIDATFKGLGLEVDSFDTIEAVQAKLEQVRNAREILRNYGSTLSADLNIIQVREDFTQAQINNAKAGADDLTVADLNEEGAKMLALQTRQQIQTTVLSLREANVLSILS